MENRLKVLNGAEIYLPHKRLRELSGTERIVQFSSHIQRAKIIVTDIANQYVDALFALGSLEKTEIPIIPFYSGPFRDRVSLEPIKENLVEYGQLQQVLHISSAQDQDGLSYFMHVIRSLYS